MLTDYKKYAKGSSGAYSADYHKIFGETPWISVKRLLPPKDTSAALFPAATSSSVALTALAGTSFPHLSEGDVATIFSQFGEVEDVRFLRHHKTGHFLGTGFVRFKNYQSGIAAANEMNSNFETGELCILYPSIPNALGIIVERCFPNDISSSVLSDSKNAALGSTAKNYEEWISQCVSSSTLPPFWLSL